MAKTNKGVPNGNKTNDGSGNRSGAVVPRVDKVADKVGNSDVVVNSARLEHGKEAAAASGQNEAVKGAPKGRKGSSAPGVSCKDDSLFGTPVSVEFFDDRFYKVNIKGETKDEDSVEFYPSITTILGVTRKHGIEHWRGDIGNREADLRMEEAADAGSRIHHACQAILCGGLALYNPRYQPVYSAEQIDEMRKEFGWKLWVFTRQSEWMSVVRFKQWLEVVKPILVDTERTVWDHENKVAGTMDYLFYIREGEYKINGATPLKLPAGYYVADLKTGKHIDDDAHVQVAKYAQMISRMIIAGDYAFSGENMPELKYVKEGLIIHTNANIKTGIEGLSTKYLPYSETSESAAYFDSALFPVWKRKTDAKPRIFNVPTAIRWQGAQVG